MAPAEGSAHMDAQGRGGPPQRLGVAKTQEIITPGVQSLRVGECSARQVAERSTATVTAVTLPTRKAAPSNDRGGVAARTAAPVGEPQVADTV